MKKLIFLAVFLLEIAVLYGCTPESQGADKIKADSPSTQNELDVISAQMKTDATSVRIVPSVLYATDTEKGDENKNVELQSERELLLSVNGNVLSVSWEDNSSVDALRELVQDEDLSIQMMPFGGFEQVGSLPDNIIRNDVQITTAPGDIVLYAGNSIVLFYGRNSWEYTKLGHIEASLEELQELLDREKVIVEISFAE